MEAITNGPDDTATAPEPEQGVAAPAADAEGFNWTGLALAGSLVVGVFAATGITGDATARVVRNLPIPTSIAIGAVILAVAIAVGGRAPSWWEKLCVAAAGLGLVGLVVLSAASLNVREMPELSVSVAPDSSENIRSVTLTASGHGLRSNEKMLVQMIGLTEEYESHDRSEELCVRSFDLAEKDPATAPHIRLLLWNESGPDSSGRARTAATTLVSAQFNQVCAYVALRARGEAVSPFTWALWLAPE
jgi:hypothetical protein